ncbi:MAG: family 43 glycosylhydrolase [Prevotella sp.]|nr:family 43 glycosylhydrolase [Prevotella sp.]
MKIRRLLFLGFLLIAFISSAQARNDIGHWPSLPDEEQIAPPSGEFDTPLDSIRLSDPAILADKKTQMYYMTGTGGMMWCSKDLRLWDGPYRVTEFDKDSWMGPRPMIWAAEPHLINGTYYYFATFTNREVKIDTVRGNVIERRACQVLRADNPMGPYRTFGDATYLPANRPTLDGTFWRDTDGKPYMVFCGEWLQNWNGTIEKIELKPDFSGTIGSPKVLFRASDSPWSREKDEDGNVTWNKVTDGPWLFRTETGRLGMLWTSWVFGDYTQGVAYSESGTLDGPWIQEPNPITPPNFGHSMLFQRFDGQWMMAVHSHAKDSRGRTVRIPHLFEVDLTGDKIVVKTE